MAPPAETTLTEAPEPGEAAAAPTRIDRGVTDYLQHMGVERGLAANTLAA
jgi:integrase/recombinase XerD